MMGRRALKELKAVLSEAWLVHQKDIGILALVLGFLGLLFLGALGATGWRTSPGLGLAPDRECLHGPVGRAQFCREVPPAQPEEPRAP